MLEKIHISCMYGLLWPSSIIVIVHLRETTEYKDQETSIDHIVISTLSVRSQPHVEGKPQTVNTLCYRIGGQLMTEALAFLPSKTMTPDE